MFEIECLVFLLGVLCSAFAGVGLGWVFGILVSFSFCWLGFRSVVGLGRVKAWFDAGLG